MKLLPQILPTIRQNTMVVQNQSSVIKQQNKDSFEHTEKRNISFGSKEDNNPYRQILQDPDKMKSFGIFVASVYEQLHLTDLPNYLSDVFASLIQKANDSSEIATPKTTYAINIAPASLNKEESFVITQETTPDTETTKELTKEEKAEILKQKRIENIMKARIARAEKRNQRLTEEQVQISEQITSDKSAEINTEKSQISTSVSTTKKIKKMSTRHGLILHRGRQPLAVQELQKVLPELKNVSDDTYNDLIDIANPLIVAKEYETISKLTNDLNMSDKTDNDVKEINKKYASPKTLEQERAVETEYVELLPINSNAPSYKLFNKHLKYLKANLDIDVYNNFVTMCNKFVPNGLRYYVNEEKTKDATSTGILNDIIKKDLKDIYKIPTENLSNHIAEITQKYNDFQLAPAKITTAISKNEKPQPQEVVPENSQNESGDLKNIITFHNVPTEMNEIAKDLQESIWLNSPVENCNILQAVAQAILEIGDIKMANQLKADIDNYKGDDKKIKQVINSTQKSILNKIQNVDILAETNKQLSQYHYQIYSSNPIAQYETKITADNIINEINKHKYKNINDDNANIIASVINNMPGEYKAKYSLHSIMRFIDRFGMINDAYSIDKQDLQNQLNDKLYYLDTLLKYAILFKKGTDNKPFCKTKSTENIKQNGWIFEIRISPQNIRNKEFKKQIISKLGNKEIIADLNYSVSGSYVISTVIKDTLPYKQLSQR